MQDLKSSLARVREMLKTHTAEIPPHVRLICHEIETIQRRLGTAAEMPDDPARVRTLAHDLNNLCTRLILKEVG